jgi:hypothetical protein
VKLTKKVLKQIILEELKSLSETDGVASQSDKRKKKRESERKQKERDKEREFKKTVFPGKMELDRLQSGIIEDGKGKPLCSDEQGDHANPYHDEDGQFTSPEKSAGSWSNMPWGPHGSDCASGRKKRNSSNKSTQFTKIPCGRKTRAGGKEPTKCKDASPAYQESLVDETDPFIKVRKSAFKNLLTQELSKLIDNWEDFLDEKESLLEQSSSDSQRKLVQTCRRYGLLSWKEFLERQDAYVRSAEGKLNEPVKKKG